MQQTKEEEKRACFGEYKEILECFIIGRFLKKSGVD
jgi:hypothetical protein